MANVIMFMLMAIAVACWGILLYTDWKWKTYKDERQARWRYEDNDEFDYGHDVKHNSEE